MQRFQERKVYKKYIDVITYIKKNGEIKPLEIIWDDTSRYRIEKIHSVKSGTSIVGGCGLRFECLISGKWRMLFYERDRWFMESEKP